MRWCLARVYDIQAIWEVFFAHHAWTVDNLKRKDAAKRNVKVEYLPLLEQKDNTPFAFKWSVTVQDIDKKSYQTKQVEVVDISEDKPLLDLGRHLIE